MIYRTRRKNGYAQNRQCIDKKQTNLWMRSILKQRTNNEMNLDRKTTDSWSLFLDEVTTVIMGTGAYKEMNEMNKFCVRS